jgi:CRP/FNR family transcriptional regulator, cyclic AMP receptor protein
MPMKTANYFRSTDRTISFERGETIFSEGDPGAEMFGVLEGEVELRTGDRVIERLGEQGVFGELALIDHAPRTLTAVAAQDCRLAVIDNRQFLWLVHETPTFALHVMTTLADRLRTVTHAGDPRPAREDTRKVSG